MNFVVHLIRQFSNRPLYLFSSPTLLLFLRVARVIACSAQHSDREEPESDTRVKPPWVFFSRHFPITGTMVYSTQIGVPFLTRSREMGERRVLIANQLLVANLTDIWERLAHIFLADKPGGVDLNRPTIDVRVVVGDCVDIRLDQLDIIVAEIYSSLRLNVRRTQAHP